MYAYIVQISISPEITRLSFTGKRVTVVKKGGTPKNCKKKFLTDYSSV